MSETGREVRLYANKSRVVFVASGNECPRANITYEGKTAKFRDDYSAGFRVSKKIAKVLKFD